MIDRKVKYIPVIMLARHIEGYPRYTLPKGYSFGFFNEDTGVSDWIHVQRAAKSLEGNGLEELFSHEFSDLHGLLKARMLFVYDACGSPVATATLWQGNAFGCDLPRLHWVATDEAHQKRGIMKALMTIIFDMCVELGFSSMYLVSQTNSYAAVNVYQSFGFERVVSERPISFSLEDFEKASKEAWDIIDKHIDAYSGTSTGHGG